VEELLKEFESRVYDCGLYRGGNGLSWKPEEAQRLRELRDKAFENLMQEIKKAERSHR
jgi:hypothetical protein